MFEPPEGPPEHLVERIRSLLRPVDPAFVATWKGVPDTLIDDYARLAGFGRLEHLPPAYVSHLRGLGAQDAYILYPVGVLDTKLIEVLDCYRPNEPVAETVEHLPICAMYFMVGGWISFDRQPGTSRPLSILANEGEETMPVDEWDVVQATSWESLIVEAAVWRCAWRKCQRSIVLSANPRDLKTALGASDRGTARRAIEDFGVRHGLAVARSSGVRHLIMVGDRRALWASVSLRGKDAADVLLYGFSDDQSFIDAVESELGPTLGRGLASGKPVKEPSRRDLPR
jgi:hypothetical protein